jgi:ribosomal-protein-alanine N-acetyltransferase
MMGADLERVIEIAESLKEAPRWARTAYLAALEAEGAPARIALVAEMTGPLGDVVGFAVGRVVGPEAELETIGVVGEAQRGGVAGRLFSALAEELRKTQAEELLLEVRVSNRPALGFYRSLGFEETGRRPGYYAEPVEDAVLMRLRLQ